jgi:hypothetical protein
LASAVWERVSVVMVHILEGVEKFLSRSELSVPGVAGALQGEPGPIRVKPVVVSAAMRTVGGKQAGRGARNSPSAGTGPLWPAQQPATPLRETLRSVNSRAV